MRVHEAVLGDDMIPTTNVAEVLIYNGLKSEQITILTFYNQFDLDLGIHTDLHNDMCTINDNGQ